MLFRSNPAVGPDAIFPTVPFAEIVVKAPVEIEDVVLALVISTLAIGYVLAVSDVFAEDPSANQVPFKAVHAPPELDVSNDPEVVLLKLSAKLEKAPPRVLKPFIVIAPNVPRIGDILFLCELTL